MFFFYISNYDYFYFGPENIVNFYVSWNTPISRLAGLVHINQFLEIFHLSMKLAEEARCLPDLLVWVKYEMLTTWETLFFSDKKSGKISGAYFQFILALNI